MHKTERRIGALAGLALSLSLASNGAWADSLREIYELALENDAQLKAEEAQYLACREMEMLAVSHLLPKVGALYEKGGSDTNTIAQSPDV